MHDKMDIDNILYELKKLNIEFDEYNELIQTFSLKEITIEYLQKTEQRYQRYLRHVTTWIIEGTSYEHLKEKIEQFLNWPITIIFYKPKINLMYEIDRELLFILNYYKVNV